MNAVAVPQTSVPVVSYQELVQMSQQRLQRIEAIKHEVAQETPPDPTPVVETV